MRLVSKAALFAAVWAWAMPALSAPVSITLPEDTAEFRPGPGVEVADANCKTCHSADYVSYQPPHKGAEFWTAEVNKMIKIFGAPISDEDARIIADYLAATY